MVIMFTITKTLNTFTGDIKEVGSKSLSFRNGNYDYQKTSLEVVKDLKEFSKRNKKFKNSSWVWKERCAGVFKEQETSSLTLTWMNVRSEEDLGGYRRKKLEEDNGPI